MEKLVHEEAKDVFDAFAGMDAPNLPNDPVSALQVRLYRWQIHNFGLQPDWTMMAGIVEEVGELSDARGHGRDQELDAVGDTCVYASQLLTATRLSLAVVLREVESRLTPATEGARYEKHLLSALGKLNHTVLKREQRIRGLDDDDRYRMYVCESVIRILTWVGRYLDLREITSVLTEVAESVMKRQWREHPFDADKRVPS